MNGRGSLPVSGRWTRFDKTDDVWLGLQTRRVMRGITLPSVAVVRARVADLVQRRSAATAQLDPSGGLRRQIPRDQVRDWTERLVVEGPAQPGPDDLALERAAGDLGDLPFRMELGADGASMRFQHAIFDAWSQLALCSVLFAPGHHLAAPPRWVEVDSRRRSFIAVADILTRPVQVTKVVATKRALAGGKYKPMDAAEREAFETILRLSEAEFLDQLRAARDRLAPRASAAAFALTGLRCSIARQMVEPRPGAEVVFDNRRAHPSSTSAFGNWSAGVYLTTADDHDPEALSDAIRAARASGVPLLGSAMRRFLPRPRNRGARLVAEGGHRPRISLSWVGEERSPHPFPWIPGAPNVSVISTPPNGLGGIAISAQELNGRLNLGVSFYPQSWPQPALVRAIDNWISDPGAALSTDETGR